MTTRNRLADPTAPRDDRGKWSLQQHCEYANAQLILKDGNVKRRSRGLPPIRWVVRGDRVVCIWADEQAG